MQNALRDMALSATGGSNPSLLTSCVYFGVVISAALVVIDWLDINFLQKGFQRYA